MILLLPRTAGEGVRLERTSSIYARFANYQKSSEIFNLSPVFGVGYNNLCLVKSDLGENPNTRSCSGLDSSLWVVLATTGVVGLMILIGSGKQVLNKLNNNMYAKVFITCLWALLVHSLFVNSLFYPWVMGWMGILLAISLTQKTSEQ